MVEGFQVHNYWFQVHNWVFIAFACFLTQSYYCTTIDEIEEDNDNEIEEDDPPSAEVRFVPDDKSTCMLTYGFVLVYTYNKITLQFSSDM